MLSLVMECMGLGSSLDAIGNIALIPCLFSMYPVTISTELFLLSRIKVIIENAFVVSVINI